MSSTRAQVSLSSRLALGRLLPQPRWSNSTTRQRDGSKKRRMVGLIAPPGPPCSTTAGLPARRAALLLIDLVPVADVEPAGGEGLVST